MKSYDMKEIFLDSPIIAAVKDEHLLEKAIQSDCHVFFILYGTICNIDVIVERIKQKGKLAFVDVDLIQGLGNRDIAVNFIKDHTRADGIISTKQNIIRHAKEMHITTGERSFIVDSMAFQTIQNHIKTIQPDFLEIMPGLVTDIIKQLSELSSIPIVASGLIRSKADILSALNAGAQAISTTRPELWDL